MKIALQERDVKRWIRDNYNGWVDSVEFAPGGSNGAPDLILGVMKLYVPMELKVGLIEERYKAPESSGNMVLKVPKEKVRASQVRWHREFAKMGLVSLIAVGVPVFKSFSICLMPGRLLPALMSEEGTQAYLIASLDPEGFFGSVTRAVSWSIELNEKAMDVERDEEETI